jgi:hypothetical protein
VFIHGINVREEEGDYFSGVERMLRHYVAPKISDQPENVSITAGYWGDLASILAWGGKSCPAGSLYGMGAAAIATTDDERAVASADLLDLLPAPTPPASGGDGGLLTMGVGSGGSAGRARLRDLRPAGLSDLLVTLLREKTPTAGALPDWLIAADALANDQGVRRQLELAPDRAGEITLIEKELLARAPAAPAVLGMGADQWISDLGDRLEETFRRAEALPGSLATQLISYLRSPLNRRFARLAGDVFTYLSGRGDPQNPGPIVQRVIGTLDAAIRARLKPDERLIVVTHSMGGQIVYDLVTWFLPVARRNMRIDFWCATASQVGLFAELHQFEATKGYNTPQVVPRPDNEYLGYWWNTWDPNDFASFTASGIVDGCDSEPYKSGLSVIAAHGGYLIQPSFYRKLAEKVDVAQSQNWQA